MLRRTRGKQQRRIWKKVNGKARDSERSLEEEELEKPAPLLKHINNSVQRRVYETSKDDEMQLQGEQHLLKTNTAIPMQKQRVTMNTTITDTSADPRARRYSASQDRARQFCPSLLLPWV